jgi:hypothetical protein
MNKINEDSRASLAFQLKWKSALAGHREIYYAENVNFWRDIFPEEVYRSIMESKDGDRMSFILGPGDAGLFFNEKETFAVHSRQFDRRILNGHRIEPRYGRFYPKGLLKGVPNVYSGNIEPFRCLGVGKDKLEIDFNHPLAKTEMELEVSVHDVKDKKEGDRGGRLSNWMEVITEGPGMQARINGHATDFFGDDPFARSDENEDIVFYEKPRLVTHIDDKARDIISSLYGNLLKPGMRVLDLMSSWRSHLPEGLQLESVVGLGMNAEEMENNPQLTEYVIHDLNANPRIPFDDRTFDAVICTVSVEYMVQPFEVFEDVKRLLKPGGYFINTFSNRWFPPKVVHVWQELSEFERIGLVLEYFARSDGYEGLKTYSSRGWPRPETDRYYPNIWTADPVYAVWGQAKA